MIEKLKATNAKAARRECSSRWPASNVRLDGFTSDGERVYISLVRKRGDKAHLATATKGIKPIWFEALVLEEVKAK